MDGTPFATRVRSLHEGWLERRESWLLGRARDRDSQRRVLANIHRWAGECIADVRHVYGETLPIASDPLGERDRFAITVGSGQRAAFELVDRGSAERPAWQVVARIDAGGEPGQSPDERRVRHWRRAQVEEILLSLLSAHERSLSREPIA